MWIASRKTLNTCYFDLRSPSYYFVWAFHRSFGCFHTLHAIIPTKTRRFFTWLVVSSVPSLSSPCSPHRHVDSCPMNDYSGHCHPNTPMKRGSIAAQRSALMSRYRVFFFMPIWTPTLAHVLLQRIPHATVLFRHKLLFLCLRLKTNGTTSHPLVASLQASSFNVQPPLPLICAAPYPLQSPTI